MTDGAIEHSLEDGYDILSIHSSDNELYDDSAPFSLDLTKSHAESIDGDLSEMENDADDEGDVSSHTIGDSQCLSSSYGTIGELTARTDCEDSQVARLQGQIKLGYPSNLSSSGEVIANLDEDLYFPGSAVKHYGDECEDTENDAEDPVQYSFQHIAATAAAASSSSSQRTLGQTLIRPPMKEHVERARYTWHQPQRVRAVPPSSTGLQSYRRPLLVGVGVLLLVREFVQLYFYGEQGDFLTNATIVNALAGPFVALYNLFARNSSYERNTSSTAFFSFGSWGLHTQHHGNLLDDLRNLPSAVRMPSLESVEDMFREIAIQFYRAIVKLRTVSQEELPRLLNKIHPYYSAPMRIALNTFNGTYNERAGELWKKTLGKEIGPSFKSMWDLGRQHAAQFVR